MKFRLLLLLLLGTMAGHGQTIVKFDFHLYTDSLKKGFYNYINVDAQLSDSSWRPLDSTKVIFTANTGFFKGNDLFIDSSYQHDSVRVRATLRENPKRWIDTVIYIRRRGFGELPTEQEVIDGKATKAPRKRQ
ncbi:hypothetical protein [Flaviaesturariibacter aridisoli]|uniref:Uncharacterized protein n=1 Tax=Flaviaesturariibacter aridisoli TaxID=2545761 RepID=A0A4R4E1Y1_9BACT|nr:hypothetical protein [Flaviaesturariibacter aridisoli]TCZ69077.1 hypothetical protein E0486_12915 [Flaviaesturariibacter aridisoli]